MKKASNHKFKVNTFLKMSEEYRHTITDEEELVKQNVTSLFFRELDYMIKHGEIIKLNINAKMRLGKSTVAIAIGYYIFEKLKEFGMKDKSDSFGISNIARDQQEYSKLMRNPDLNFNVIVVDEDNTMEKTGENSSTEQALLGDQSSIQAGRYIHDIKVSPKGLNDDNADLLLDVISMDKENMVNHCLLSYRYQQGLREHTQLIGYVNVYVGDIVSNWVKNVMPVHKRIMQGKGTRDDEIYLAEQKKSDFYVNYYLKKHEKMDLLNKEGIFRPRMLDYADIYLSIIAKLSPLTKITGAVNDKIIRSYVKMEFRRAKIPLSIIGEVNSTADVGSILNLYISKHRVNKQIKDIENKVFSNKVSALEGDEQIKELINIRLALDEAITTQITELEHYNEIKERYNDVFR